jgi:hypothetical protein
MPLYANKKAGDECKNESLDEEIGMGGLPFLFDKRVGMVGIGLVGG